MSMLQSAPSYEARGQAEVKSAEALLREALDKLRNTAPKKLKELRDECTASIEKLDAAAGGPVNADEHFKPLKLACEAAGNPKVVAIALSAIQKLISYGFLTGRGPDPFKEAAAGSPPRRLTDAIVECVGGCAEQADDTVQNEMVRALLTAVMSQTCEVHGNSLMLAVRTCFQIHRDSRNQMNQRTAQASLTQMLNVVTQRMELSSADMSRRTVSSDIDAEQKSQQAAKLASSDLALLPARQLLGDWTASYVTRLVDKAVLNEQRRTGRAVDGGGERKDPPGKFGWCVVCRAPAPHYCRETQDPVCGKACKYRNLERLNLVETYYGAKAEGDDQDGRAVPEATEAPPDNTETAESELSTAVGESLATEEPTASERCSEAPLEALSPPAAPPEDGGGVGFDGGDQDGESNSAQALNPHHRDALMVFSSFCRLSMKDLPPGQADVRMVRSKKLALELVLNMLRNCGPVFRSSEPFIAVLKKLLCVSLIKNSVSSNPKVFSLSLEIFVMLITSFKEHLRTEIGVFIEQIFLRILESGNSTYQHKNRVLQVFYKLCTDASTALELFLNFDCDVDEKNIFERMIDCLSKIAQGKYEAREHANSIHPEQEKELKMLALQALVTLMGSIVDWARRMTEDQQQVAAAAAEVQAKEADSDGEEDAKSIATDTTTTNNNTNHAALTTLTTDVPASIVANKQRKHDLQIGVHKFNMKPKRGIEYLKQNGFVSDDPDAIAALFCRTDIGLDKTAIGDFLGEDKPLNKSVLYSLVDGQDFKERKLDDALRQFLSLFRLPGEAQKIDRMMEKFAEKYCNDNPDKFANADCAFVLSFSLIMLQTDLHNPGIRNRMKKDDFVHNNRGINDGQDLPREWLEELYDGVANNPFSLQEDELARTRMESQAAQGASQKFELFVRETENIVQKSQEMMKQKVMRQKSSAYVTAHNVEHVRPLFEVACWPMLATLAVILEMQDAQPSVERCIEGFKHCIRIAARFDMDTERNAFVSSLAKFTYLTTIKEMKQKNIECIKALLAIGLSEGDNLGPSWQFVLLCISQLERLQLIGSRARQDHQFFQGDEEATSTNGGNAVVKRRAHGLGVSALVAMGVDDRQVELVNSESVMTQIDAAQIDLLFNRSTSLGPNAVVHFVTQLARVSKEELLLVDQPRIFSLQKLVEVADYNMNRIRVVWTRIWRVLSNHFIEVAGHPNIRVCVYAIDSLRQLAMKFLEKDELANYNFQADFLRPFETVMLAPGVNKEVKDFIVSIISTMVQARMHSIKSGWKTVFHILSAAALDQGSEGTTQTAFGVVEKVVSSNYEIFAENFSDGIRTLLAFGQCQASVPQSLQSITYLLQAAEYLADKSKPDPPPPPSSSLADGGPVTSSSHPAAHWFPILRGLSMLVSDTRRDVRAAALAGVFDCLRDYGAVVFDEDTWRMVFNGVVKPLFDDIHHQLQHGDQPDGTGSQGSAGAQGDAVNRSEGTAASWAAAMGPPTCLAALTALVRLFEVHLDALAFLLDDVLRLIESCVQHDTEAVARIGVEGFKQLLLTTGQRLRPESWQKVTPVVLRLFRDSLPTALMSDEIRTSGDGELPFQKNDVVIQCVVQLLLIDMLQDTVEKHYEHIPPDGVMTLLDALKQSFEFAQEFNQQIELRELLKKKGFMREMVQLPGLLKQEREALSCSLKTLFQVQADERMRGTEYASQAVERLMSLCSTVLKNYVHKEQLLQEQTEASAELSGDGVRSSESVAAKMEREVLGLVPIIADVVLKGLKDLDRQQFARYARVLFPLLCELTTVTSREVRLMVRDVLLEQVTPLVGNGPAP